MKQGMCGIALEDGILSVLLCARERAQLIPCAEFSLPAGSDDLLEVLGKNIEKLDEEITKHEEEKSIVVDQVYCVLPFGWQRFKIADDIFPLAKDKKKAVFAKEIVQAKDHMEGVMLDWNERCIHNIILEYHLDGEVFRQLPAQVSARKLKLKSLLVSIERKIFSEIQALFHNIDRQFMAFIWWPLAELSVNASDKIPVPYVTVDIRRHETYCSILSDEGIVFEKFDMNSVQIQRKIAEKFSLSPQVCQDILDHYVGFQSVMSGKEVVMKEAGRYVSINTTAISQYLQEILREELSEIIEFIKRYISQEYKILFLGQFAVLKGFTAFIRGQFPGLQTEISSFRSSSSYLLGCVKYGCQRYLERTIPQAGIFNRLMNMYRDYF
ncbi:MAG: hypothetical protein JXD21_05805 [Candidatus Omnitrophica bacterium]|nr:hypothetical protein [Candidatus Omnitrophota bacterium]